MTDVKIQDVEGRIISCSPSYNYTTGLSMGSNPIAGESDFHAFDGNTSTKWLVFESRLSLSYPVWLQVALPENMRFKPYDYSIWSANDEVTRDPKTWMIWGSNDAESWDNLHQVTNATFTNRFSLADGTSYPSYQPNTWPPAQAYRYFRLVITAKRQTLSPTSSLGNSAIQLSEWQLRGLPITLASGGGDPYVIPYRANGKIYKLPNNLTQLNLWTHAGYPKVKIVANIGKLPIGQVMQNHHLSQLQKVLQMSADYFVSLEFYPGPLIMSTIDGTISGSQEFWQVRPLEFFTPSLWLKQTNNAWEIELSEPVKVRMLIGINMRDLSLNDIRLLTPYAEDSQVSGALIDDQILNFDYS